MCIGYIHNNSYYLIDVTNHSTRWGVWNPQPLNFNYSWSDEHGLNSLQIVTYLLSAYRLTGREEYLQAWAVSKPSNTNITFSLVSPLLSLPPISLPPSFSLSPPPPPPPPPIPLWTLPLYLTSLPSPPLIRTYQLMMVYIMVSLLIMVLISSIKKSHFLEMIIIVTMS